MPPKIVLSFQYSTICPLATPRGHIPAVLCYPIFSSLFLTPQNRSSSFVGSFFPLLSPSFFGKFSHVPPSPPSFWSFFRFVTHACSLHLHAFFIHSSSLLFFVSGTYSQNAIFPPQCPNHPCPTVWVGGGISSQRPFLRDLGMSPCIHRFAPLSDWSLSP